MANHWPCNRILGYVLRRKKSPAISTFNDRAVMCYSLLGRAARFSGLPLVSYSFQMAWHGLFVRLWKECFHYHALTIAKLRWYCKNYFQKSFRSVLNGPPAGRRQAGAVRGAVTIAGPKLKRASCPCACRLLRCSPTLPGLRCAILATLAPDDPGRMPCRATISPSPPERAKAAAPVPGAGYGELSGAGRIRCMVWRALVAGTPLFGGTRRLFSSRRQIA